MPFAKNRNALHASLASSLTILCVRTILVTAKHSHKTVFVRNATINSTSLDTPAFKKRWSVLSIATSLTLIETVSIVRRG